jgi:hypothetical protein
VQCSKNVSKIHKLGVWILFRSFYRYTIEWFEGLEKLNKSLGEARLFFPNTWYARKTRVAFIIEKMARYIISKDGIPTNLEKIEAIGRLPFSKKKKEKGYFESYWLLSKICFQI